MEKKETLKEDADIKTGNIHKARKTRKARKRDTKQRRRKTHKAKKKDTPRQKRYTKQGRKAHFKELDRNQGRKRCIKQDTQSKEETDV